MNLTETDLINMRITAEARLNGSDIVKALIEEDVHSRKKAIMAEGEKYYVGEHDILNKDFRNSYLSSTKEGADGQEREFREIFRNPNRSNQRNVSAFHAILVDQKAAYLLGRPPTVTVDGAERNKKLRIFEEIISNAAKEEFNEVFYNMVVGASNKGTEFLHFYYDGGKLKYTIVPSEEIIPIYDSEYESEIVELIRYYTIATVKGKERALRKKVEWWTKSGVTYFAEDERGNFIHDAAYSGGYTPHFWEVKKVNGVETKREAHSWGRVPFIVLRNNSRETTDLQKIKNLIDGYDLISSQGTNDLLDLVALYWSIQGYGGETAGTIAKKLQINRAVNISDSSGAISAKQVDLPVEGRIAWLNMLRRDIFRFGMGIDTENDKLGNASGVSLKFQYTQLDLKANSMTPMLKKAIKEFFWFVTEDYNRKNGSDFDSNLISVALNKTMITNDYEIVEMIEKSKDIVSQKTLLARHPFVDDANEEIEEFMYQQGLREPSENKVAKGEKSLLEEVEKGSELKESI
ncbi:MAG: phage portal protein [Firmicutes bacterium]|nr:phage portal protein [Bacillota bacterium]